MCVVNKHERVLFYCTKKKNTMFRYILAILLINTCYHSSGTPVPQRISSSLSVLGSHCENKFLNDVIKNKIKDCSVTVPPFSERQLQCLILYDMSNQLCSAVTASQLVLSEDYTAKINEEQNVNNLCETAKEWVFNNLAEYAVYKTVLEHAFKSTVACGKVCGADELTSTDANFFCKYYNWGSAALKTSTTTPAQKNVNATLPAPVSGIASTDNKNEASDQANESQDIPIKNTTYEKPKVTEASSASTPEKANNPVSVENKQETVLSTNKEVSSSVAVPKVEKPEETKLDEPPVLSENAISGNDLVDKEVENSLPVAKEQKDGAHNVLENPKKSPNDGFDYQDTDVESEEGKDGLIDMQGGDDGDDPMIDDTKANKEQSKANDHMEPSLTSFNHDISQKDYYHSFESGDDDDDHFFSLFLTVIIVSVVLYVLYHNKNKINKLFFGLLLEGRQAGRRRNSRGHAYRRLDTLEQAMSSNTAAPPSKIIY